MVASELWLSLLWILAPTFSAVSPVTWIHVNFYERYTFTEEPAAVPVEGCVEALALYAFRSNEPASTPPRERSA